MLKEGKTLQDSTHVLLINISASFGDALQALADDGHHMPLYV